MGNARLERDDPRQIAENGAIVAWGTIRFVDRSSSRGRAISHSPEIQGGTPIFSGTRVPVAVLFDYIAEGETLETFLSQYPSVSRAQVIEVLETAKACLAGTTQRI